MVMNREMKRSSSMYLFMAMNDDEFIPVVRSGDKSGAGFHGETNGIE